MKPRLHVAPESLLSGLDKRTYWVLVAVIVGIIVAAFSAVESVFGLEGAIFGLVWPFSESGLREQYHVITTYTGIVWALYIVLVFFAAILFQASRDEKYLTTDQMKEFQSHIQRLGVSARLPEVKDAIETIDRSGRMPVYYELRSLRKYVKHRDRVAKKLRQDFIRTPEVGEEYKQTWQSILSDTLGKKAN